MLMLRQSTASQEVVLGFFLDSSDGNTEETGLTIYNTDIKIWKAGATSLASKNSGGATHISNGVYYCVLDATDTDTLGPLMILVHLTGTLPVRVECLVVPSNVYDSLVLGTDALDTNVSKWADTTVATPDTAGYPKVTLKTGTGTGEVVLASGAVDADVETWRGTQVNVLQSGRVDGYVGAMGSSVLTSSAIANAAITASAFATGAIDAGALSADAVDEILDEVVEGTLTLRKSIMAIFAASAGKSSGGGTSTIVFRDYADSLNRISATVDSNGNRTAITYNFS